MPTGSNEMGVNDVANKAIPEVESKGDARDGRDEVHPKAWARPGLQSTSALTTKMITTQFCGQNTQGDGEQE
jgi:hypothetical protein